MGSQINPTCPICGHENGEILFERTQVPAFQNRLYPDPASARAVPRGDMVLASCPECTALWNLRFDPQKTQYGENYEASQEFSPLCDSHFQGWVGKLIEERGIKNKTLLEIGCGQGHFLKRLVEDSTHGNRGLGMDPTYEGAATACEGRARFQRAFFTSGNTREKFDAVFCRHVLEHLPQPKEFLQQLNPLLNGAQAGLYFETPRLEWILENQNYWDLFYEHCFYFSALALRRCFTEAGFKVRSLETLFGEQHWWLETGTQEKESWADFDKAGLLRQLRDFFAGEKVWNESWRIKIQALAKEGPLVLWGAGAKGVTFANLIDPEAKYLNFLVDVNPRKQGHYIPGSAHPIWGLETLVQQGVQRVLLMNPAYRSEIEGALAEKHLPVQVLDLSEEK